MSIQLKLSTTLRAHVADYDPLEGLELAAEPGLTVAAVMERLGIPAREVKVVMLNGRHARAGAALAEGDRLALFPAVGGG